MLQDGVSKLVFKQDTKLEFAGTFTIMHEDHTLGNMVRMQLHLDRTIVFAGYRIPHPLTAKMVIKVQTNGVKSPENAVIHALDDLTTEVTTIQSKLAMEMARIKSTQAAF